MLVSKGETPLSAVDVTAFLKREYFSESLIPATVRDYNAFLAMVNGIQPSVNFKVVFQPYTIPSMVLGKTDSDVL